MQTPGYNYNTELLKYALLLVSVPFWWPFVKALREELNDALRSEGGLFGEEPTAEELAAMNLERGAYVSPMVSEPRERSQAGSWKKKAEVPTISTSDPLAFLAEPAESVEDARPGFGRRRQRKGFGPPRG